MFGAHAARGRPMIPRDGVEPYQLAVLLQQMNLSTPFDRH